MHSYPNLTYPYSGYSFFFIIMLVHIGMYALLGGNARKQTNIQVRELKTTTRGKNTIHHPSCHGFFLPPPPHLRKEKDKQERRRKEIKESASPSSQ